MCYLSREKYLIFGNKKNINESIRYDSDMYYISNCVNESQDVNTLTKKCRDIQGRYGIEVGYELQGNAKLSGEYVTVIYVNDTMEKIRYKLKYGMWFEIGLPQSHWL